MTKKISTLSALILLVVIAYAQPPGYMGKRLMLGYSLQVFPAINNPPANFTESGVGVNLGHSFNADYIVAPKTSIKLSHTRYRSGYDFGRNDLEFIHEDQRPGMNGSSTYYFSPENIVLSSALTEATFKFYNTLAPSFYFMGLSIGYRASKAEEGYVNTTLFRSYQFSSFPDPADPYNGQSTWKHDLPNTLGAVTLGLEGGYERVLFDRVKITYSTIFRLSFSKYSVYNGAEGATYLSVWDKSEELDMRRRLFEGGLFAFKIGISFLTL